MTSGEKQPYLVNQNLRLNQIKAFQSSRIWINRGLL